MVVFHLINALSHSRFTWILLLILGIVLEGCGLYFQYELRLPPCVYCVYERAFYLSFIVAGFIGFLHPHNFIFRNLAILIFGAGSVGGIMVTLEHLASYYQEGFGVKCPFKANFPEFFKLDEWLPWMFSPTSSCGKLDWSLLGLSMPQWIIVSFICGMLVAVLFFVSQFFRKKKRDYMDFYH